MSETSEQSESCKNNCTNPSSGMAKSHKQNPGFTPLRNIKSMGEQFDSTLSSERPDTRSEGVQPVWLSKIVKRPCSLKRVSALWVLYDEDTTTYLMEPYPPIL